MTPKILFVDDDPNLLAAFQRNLRKRFSFDTALGGAEALEMLASHGPYAVVVADMRMPGMSGIELLERVCTVSPASIRLMLTGNADQQTAVDAVNRGHVFGFLNKPCPPEVLVPTLESALKQHELERLERELLDGTLAGSVKLLTDVLGMVAPRALGHGQRLRESMRLFAEWLREPALWELELGALLCSIGYASVPSATLRKIDIDATLSDTEQAILTRVPQIGHDLLDAIPRLSGVADIVLYQNQHFDGTGHPGDSLCGDALPRGSRILKILADRLTLESDGVVKQQAHLAMAGRAGFYDPALLDQCFACFPEFLNQPVSRGQPVLTLPIRDLKAGQVVVSDITTLSGLVLVRAGHRLTTMMLERLRNHAELGDAREPVLVQDSAPDELPKPAAA